METKQTLGAFVCRRRKELGLTQRQLADQLFVTESAVSKWERGLSYPDITLLSALCGALQISEHELLTASEDLEGRRTTLLARRYLALLRTVRLAQILFYGVLAAAFLIGNLASYGHVGWFPIAAAAEAMAMSLTLLPVLMTDGPRTAAVCGGFSASLLLLLAACAWYGSGAWFWPAEAGTLLALTVLLLPPVLRSLALPEALRCRKASVYLLTCLVIYLVNLALWTAGDGWFWVASAGSLLGFAVLLSPVLLRQLLPKEWQRRKFTAYVGLSTVWLLLLLLACDLRNGDPMDFFSEVAVGCLLAISVLLLPLVLRQTLPGAWQRRKAAVYLAVNLALLLVLLLICDLRYGAPMGWFPEAALGSLLAASVLFLPVMLRQLPLPFRLRRHKALLNLSAFSLLLFALLAVVCLRSGGTWFWMPGAPLALLGLGLPWCFLVILRYLPWNRWKKAAGCSGVLALYTFFLPRAVERLCILGGAVFDGPRHSLGPRPDFLRWDSGWIVGENVTALLCLLWAALAVVFLVIGHRRKKDFSLRSE